jgi:CBS domain-containing protein
MKIRDLMTRDVKTCGPWDDLAVAAQAMETHGHGCLPVVDGAGRAVGMLTDHDISVAAQRAPLSALRVAGAMRTGASSCDPDDLPLAAEESMRARRIRRLPVVAADGRLVGLISASDLARKAVHQCKVRRE